MEHTPALEMLQVAGTELRPWLDRLAALRIRVFRDFPYLYDGSIEYERDYLKPYIETDTSICVLALDGDRVVGASTGLPLGHENDAFQRPFREHRLAIDRIFYCAESVLLPAYRGRGLYRAFFDGREQHARRLGLDHLTFCAVQRPKDHPLRPAGYQPLDPIWRRYGYTPQPRLVTTFAWKDIDQPDETEKTMMFYLKRLQPLD